jgi:hypothetical protein
MVKPQITALGHCAPRRVAHYMTQNTCFTPEELVRIGEEYNIRNPSNPIQIENLDTPKNLLQTLDQRFEQACQGQSSKERCWIDHLRLSELSKNFRPTQPKSWKQNKYEWLSSTDIETALNQYQELDQSFVFLGAVPIDFADRKNPGGDCISRHVCSFNIHDALRDGKTDFAMVINLDPHHKSGSHWVCCFCHFYPDDPKFGICFFDSAGKRPKRHILDFMRSIKQEVSKAYAKDVSKFFRMKYNAKQKQFGDSECGMFCIAFIITCLENPLFTYQEVCDTITSDNYVHRLRSVLFTPSPSR